MTEEYLDWRLGIFGILLVLALVVNISFLLAKSSLKKEKSSLKKEKIFLKKEKSCCPPSEETKCEPSLLEKDLESAHLSRPNYVFSIIE